MIESNRALTHAPGASRRQIAAFSSMLFATLSAFFINYSRGNMMPTIMGSFNAMQYYALITILATLSQSVTLPIAGKLGDMFGRKRLFLIGQIAYTAGTAILGLAPNILLFALGTLIAGLAQGFVNGQTNAMIGDTFPSDSDRPKYVSFNNTFGNILQLVCPLLAGMIIEGIGWRYVYYITLPINSIALLVFLRLYEEPPRTEKVRRKIDVVGLITSMTAITTLVLLLALGGSLIPWNSPTSYTLMALFILSSIILWIVDTRHPEPVIPFSLFKNRTYTLVFFGGLCMSIGAVGLLTYMPQYLQIILGMSATVSASVQMPRNLLIAVLALVMGHYISKTDRYKSTMVISLSLGLVSYAMMIFGFGVNTGTPYIIATLLLNAFSSMGLLVVTMSWAMKLLPQQHLGSGIAILTFTATISGAMGAAIGGRLTDLAWAKTVIPDSLLAALNPEQLALLGSNNILRSGKVVEGWKAALPSNLAVTLETTLDGFREIYLGGIINTFIAFAALTLIALLLFAIIKTPKKSKKGEESH